MIASLGFMVGLGRSIPTVLARSAIAIMFSVGTLGCAHHARPADPGFRVTVKPIDGASRWQVDTKASRLTAHVSPSGVLSGMGHEHRFEPRAWVGYLSFDPEHVEDTGGVIEVHLPSLRETNEDMSPDNRESVEADTLGEKILDAKKYPSAVFHLEQVTNVSRSGPRGDGLRADIRGRMTLHNHSQQVMGKIAVRHRRGVLTMRGWVALHCSDFGIDRHTALLGALGSKDRVLVHFDVVAHRRG